MDKVWDIVGAFFLVLLFILLFLLIFAFLVCISHPKIIIKYKDKPDISVSLWFMKFNITKFMSRKKKSKIPEIIHFDGEHFGELPEKEKKKKKKAVTKHTVAPGKAKPAEKEKKPITETATEILELITDILDSIKEPLKKVLKVSIKRLYLTSASDDAFKTAILFGNMNTAAGYLIFVCRKYASLDIDEENVGVYSDFCGTKPQFDTHIVLTLSFRHIITCGLKAVMKYIKRKA